METQWRTATTVWISVQMRESPCDLTLEPQLQLVVLLVLQLPVLLMRTTAAAARLV